MNRIDLNGQWKLRWADGTRGGLAHHRLKDTDEDKWISAEVPGEVHLDLMKHGLIEDPAIGTNALTARWVEECFWSYRRTFVAPQAALNQTTWLIFEGLDYNAKIYLNEECVGTHENFFLPCRVNVTGKLRSGENILVVQLESGLFGVAEKPVSDYYHGREDGLLHKRIWLRKPQSSFSWDWSTRLLNVGIYKPVYLEWASEVRVDDVVVTTELDSNFHNGRIASKFNVEGLTKEPCRGQIAMQVIETGQTKYKDVTILPGFQMLELAEEFLNPRLWWPAGHGQQSLYTVRLTLSNSRGQVIFKREKKIGFRHIRINQDPHPNGGNYFIIEVNGRRIFVKGANFVPADMIIARINRERYRTLIDRALEANFNFLRVWGGGLYESDDFYELCDEYGIMVWQEFIFACANYPTTDEKFLKNVKAEVTYQVRRLANHASLVVWCGNNEIEWLTWNLAEGLIHPDHALFHLHIPRILKEEDPTRYYQASSPISGNNEYPNSDTLGDQHPWSIGFDNVDFREYRNMAPRFPNEGGILGPTSIEAMQSCLPQGQKFVNSFAWQIHDNGVEQWFAKSAPDRVITEWLNRNPREMSIEEFTYYGGLVQGEGLREYIDNFRRRMFDTSSAVFWMYNDCWPATRSWTIVDYYLNRTPSFYPVRRAFAPISVVVVRAQDEVSVYGINDSAKDWSGTLRYGIFTLRGEYPFDQYATVELKSNSSTCIATFSAQLWDKVGVQNSLAFASISQGGTEIARNRLILPLYHELSWVSAQVEVTRQDGHAVFSSHNFAWGVCLDLTGKEDCGDNFFDVWPAVAYKIPWADDRPLPSIVRVGNLV